jgi:hypothetical protein
MRPPRKKHNQRNDRNDGYRLKEGCLHYADCI